MSPGPSTGAAAPDTSANTMSTREPSAPDTTTSLTSPAMVQTHETNTNKNIRAYAGNSYQSSERLTSLMTPARLVARNR